MSIPMKPETQEQARAILRAVREAQRDLASPGPAKKRADSARSHFYAYTKDGPLSPFVRDVFQAGGVRAMEGAMQRLAEMAEAFARD